MYRYSQTVITKIPIEKELTTIVHFINQYKNIDVFSYLQYDIIKKEDAVLKGELPRQPGLRNMHLPL